MGRTATHTELAAAIDRINARFDRSDELIIGTANQLRTEFREEMAAHRAEMRADMAAHRAAFREEMATHRAEMRQEMRQMVVDLTQATTNHRHDPDGQVSVMMVAEPQSAYETNRLVE